MDNRIITGVVSIFAAIIILAAIMVPVIQDAGYTTTTTTTTISNEGAADLKLSKISSGFALNMTVENDGSDLTITNGTETITAGISPMFILSTDTAAIYVNEVNDVIAVWTSGGTTQQYTLTGDFSVEITESYLVIDDGADHNLPLPTSYMFVPSSTGMYGSFTEGGLNKVPGDPVIAAGYYAGVAAYNANNTLGDALAEVVIADDETITSVSWEIPSADLDQFDPDLIDFDPGQIQIQPIDINPLDPGNQIMAVPTPTYTEGDWGYDVSSGMAVIVAYLGASADTITIPAKIGGYDVTRIGKNSSSNLMDSSIATSHLIISEGIPTIGANPFNGCYLLTGPLVIPDSVTVIGQNAFVGCSGFTGTLVIKQGVSTLGAAAFKNCQGLSGLVILSDVIPGSDSFQFTTNIKQVLNLSNNNWTTTSYGLNADSVQDHIDALVYLAPDNYTSTIEVKTPNEYAPLYNILPLIILGSILLATAGMMLLRRE